MKVSIITIVYNNEAVIEDCIRSVQSQSYPKIEHIVIDGDSTDGTKKKIESFRKNLAFYISEKDNGLYDALNKGIAKATGDVIGILHSDDVFYDKDSVKRIVHTFKETHSDLVHANGLFVDKENLGKILRIYSSKPFKKRYLPFGWIPLHTTIFVKRELYENYGLYATDYSIASDYEISLRWFTNEKIKKNYLDSYVVKMRMGGKSTSANLQVKKSTEDLKIIRKYKLLDVFTLFCKIFRKIPQYMLPKLIKVQ